MKNILLLLSLSPILIFGQNTSIPDPNFEHHLIDIGLDSGLINGYVLTANISGHLGLNLTNLSISDLTGIENFTAIEILFCGDNQLTSLDISQNSALTQLSCYGNLLTSLDVSTNTSLTSINCSNNQLTSLDVSQHPTLTSLFCNGNQLSSLNANGASALSNIYCYDNQLTSIDVNGATALTSMSCGWNELISLDLNGAPALGGLNCSNNQLTSLDISQNTELSSLVCDYNQLTCLNLKNGNNINFSYMEIIGNNLSCIEVDDPAWASTNWTTTNGTIDPGVTFSTDCNYTTGCFSTPNTIVEINPIIYLFPNPTNNLITLDIEGYNGLVNVQVYDFTGKLLKTTTNTTVSIGEYAKGIYVFKVTYGDRIEKLKVFKK